MTLPNDLNIFAPGVKLLKTVVDEEAIFLNMAWSPNGKTLALASYYYGFATVDIDSLVLDWHLIGGFGGVNDIAWSPKGDEVACICADGTLLRYSLSAESKNWKERITQLDRGPSTDRVTWSSDGQLLAVAGEYEVSVWDASTGELRTRLPAESRALPIFFADSRRLLCLAGLQTASLAVWDALTGAKIQEFNNIHLENGQMLGHQGPAVALALSLDERLIATGGYDSHITLWEVGTGQPIHDLPQSHGKISSLAFSPDGLFLVGTSTDNVMRIWSGSARRDWQQVVQLPDFGGGWTGGVAFHPSRPILATGAQGGHTIHFWEYNSSAWR